MPGPVPDQGLVHPGQHLQSLDLGAVTGDRAVVGAVQAHDLTQHVRIAGVGLRPRGRVAFAVAGHRHRVDGEHLIPRGEQRADPRAAVGLDPHHDSPGREHAGLRVDGIVVEVFSDQLVQPGHPDHALGQPSPRQPPADVIEDLHVVVVLSPVVTHIQRHRCLP